MAEDPVFVSALDDVVAGHGIVAGLRAAEALAERAALASRPVLAPLTTVIDQRVDDVAAIAAIHALSAAREPEVAGLLTELLGDDRWHVVEHAAWALSARAPHRPAMPGLAELVAGGGFTAMLAQRTLGGWADGDGPAVAAAVTARLHGATGGARRRLIETLALAGGPTTTDRLATIAVDVSEPPPGRIAAVAALGERPGGHDAVLTRLAAGDDELAEHALLALVDRLAIAGDVRTTTRQGMRVAQLFLHADVDGGLETAGAGDSGGISTLLRLLSATMAARPGVGEVVTIGRGEPAQALVEAWRDATGGQRSAAVPFGRSGGVDQRDAWEYRVQVERGLRRVLRGGVDVVHLRMADVGTLAAARVARQLGLPVVFTAAPDPHGLLRSLEADGALGVADFGAADTLEHFWFRARMVERLIAQAARVVLLPRPDLAADLRELLGIDLDEETGRMAVVPEGVHAATVRAAVDDVVEAGPGTRPAGVDALVSALARLAPARQALPIVLSVGRLHPMKGMDRLVAAWASTPALHQRTNLVVVGGDLDAPSADELDVLGTIDGLVAGRPDLAEGLVLLGHRAHGEVARILAAVAIGADGVPGDGVYVGAARKEEFGLAIVEALGAGLAVVAPAGGGPATYVRDGVTGVLVDTASVPALADGIQRALALAPVPGRAAAAREEVLAELTIEAMAERLIELYATLVPVPA